MKHFIITLFLFYFSINAWGREIPLAHFDNWKQIEFNNSHISFLEQQNNNFEQKISTINEKLTFLQNNHSSLVQQFRQVRDGTGNFKGMDDIPKGSIEDSTRQQMNQCTQTIEHLKALKAFYLENIRKMDKFADMLGRHSQNIRPR